MMKTKNELIIELCEEQKENIFDMAKEKEVSISQLLSIALERYAEANNISEGHVASGTEQSHFLRVRISPKAKAAYLVLIDKMLKELVL